MKHYTIEQLCIGSSPAAYYSDGFVDQVMVRTRLPLLTPDRARHHRRRRQALFASFRHLPKFAVIILAILALVIVSTTVYAAYLLWPRPQASTSIPVKNTEGRSQLMVSFEQCGATAPAKKQYELKKDAPISESQIPQIIKAQCELQAIGTWAGRQFPDVNPPRFQPGQIKAYDAVHTEVSMPVHILSSSARTITFEGVKKYGVPEKTVAVSDKVIYIADGKKVAPRALSPGDTVAYVLRRSAHMVPGTDCTDKHCSFDYKNMHEEMVAVVKLTQPFATYDPLAWQSLAERRACLHNEADTCVSSGSIDLFMGAANGSKAKAYKIIEGKLSQHTGTTFSIVTSSGRTFTFTMDSDIIGNFNTNRSAGYNNTVIGLGDTIEVDYIEDKDTHLQHFGQKDIAMIMVKIELVSKADPIKKY